MPDPTGLRQATNYMPIEHYGLIGNMRTAALVATDGGIDFMCWPNFDSPSVFCRLLDAKKGGYFTISPPCNLKLTTKQQYLPSSNILQTMFYGEDGVMKLIDFFPRLEQEAPSSRTKQQKHQHGIAAAATDPTQSLRKWLVRRIECVRGEIDVHIMVHPAFNYARNSHTVHLYALGDETAGEAANMAVFKAKGLALELKATVDHCEEGECYPDVYFQVADGTDLGKAVEARLHLKEGQRVSFVWRDYDPEFQDSPEHVTPLLLDRVQQETKQYWFNWISQSKYCGRWQEVVQRSLLTLKLLMFEPTGAIIAAPTFGLPESIGGTRNWDYRFSWVRDSSFTIYILLRMGFRQEAEAYMSFIMDWLKYSKTETGALPIMFSIRGGTELPEIELKHLDGYRGSRPVRIGNGAAFHKQLDVYGELMDAIYLYNKYGKPVSYDDWLAVRQLTDFVCTIWHEKDMSIWEVRGETQNFTYSKIMLWVCIDRAFRLSDKRCFPCPHRLQWLSTRDQIMEMVMKYGYNKEMKCFIQCYEHPDVLDSAVLIAPLVFFVAPNDPRFIHTLEMILQPLEKGGLMSAGMVYRYNTSLSDDGNIRRSSSPI